MLLARGFGNGEYPCGSCKKPILNEDNVVSWNVFSFCSAQMVVAGMGTPLGIEFAAIDRAMEFFDVHPLDQDRVFNRVRILGELHAEILIDKQQRAMPPDQKSKVMPSVEPPPMFTKDEIGQIDREMELF